MRGFWKPVYVPKKNLPPQNRNFMQNGTPLGGNNNDNSGGGGFADSNNTNTTSSDQHLGTSQRKQECFKYKKTGNYQETTKEDDSPILTVRR